MREQQKFEESKGFDASLFNYSVYVARDLANTKAPVPTLVKHHRNQEATIDDELRYLLGEYTQAKDEAEEGLSALQERMTNKRTYLDVLEPASVRILKSKNDKEREYLQRTIITMELKQIAESITMIQFRKRIATKNGKFKNRPALWEEKIRAAPPSKELRVVPEKSKGQKKLEEQWKVDTQQLFCLKFDSSIHLSATWVDGKIMN